MPLVNKAVETVANRLPKVISPKGHAISDYIQIGLFALMGAVFWRRNKRASVAALCCAAVEAANVLLTDYPGGRSRILSLDVHKRIDTAMAGAVAGLPTLLGFAKEPEARAFRIRSGVIVGVAALTGVKREKKYSPEYKAA